MRPVRIAVLCFAVLWLCACKPERPVQEGVDLAFLADGSARIAITTELRENPEEPDATTSLIQPVLDRYARGKDEWLLRMREWGLRDISSKLTTEGEEGKPRIHRIERAGVAPDPRETIPRLFAEELAGVNLTWDSGIWTLEILPQAEPRDIREHRTEAKREIGALAARVREAQDAFASLYDYLREHPERRTEISLTLDGEEDGKIPLTSTETHIVEGTEKALDGLMGQKEGRAALEAARLHPLNFDLRVSVPTPVSETEGFDLVRPWWIIREPSLDDVFLGVLGGPFDPDFTGDSLDWKDPQALATAAFRVAPLPTQGEIEAKLTEALSMPGPYRLRWEGPAPGSRP